MNYLRPSGACCNPCDEPQIVNVPGQKGDDGDDGAPGADGINAYTVTTENFDVPAVGNTVEIEVGDTSWMADGEPIFIETAGAYRVDSITDINHVFVENLGYAGNAAPTATIVAGAKVTPSGEIGESGVTDWVSGTFSLPDASQSYTVAGLAFGFVPSQLILTLRKPSGGLNLAPCVVDGSITADGFTVYLTGATNSANYKIDYIAIE